MENGKLRMENNRKLLLLHLNAAIRARMAELADDQMSVQESLHVMPAREVSMALAWIDRNEIELARLASRLERAEDIPTVSDSEVENV